MSSYQSAARVAARLRASAARKPVRRVDAADRFARVAFGRSKRTDTGRAQLLSEWSNKWLADSYGIAGNPRLGYTMPSRHTVWRVRVVPDNGKPEFESRVSIWGETQSGRLEQGNWAYPWTYVLYDPDKPDECEIDTDRLAKEFGSIEKGEQRVTIPRPQPPVQASPRREIAEQIQATMADLSLSTEQKRVRILELLSAIRAPAPNPFGGGQPVAAAAASGVAADVDAVAKLAALRDRGAFTDAEFQALEAVFHDQTGLGRVESSDTKPRTDIADQLSKLADLRDRGVLTPGEFDEAKTKLLGSL
jgi:hypothetical protein